MPVVVSDTRYPTTTFGLPSAVMSTIQVDITGFTKVHATMRGPVYDRMASADGPTVTVHLTRSSGVTSAGRLLTTTRRRDQRQTDNTLIITITRLMEWLLGGEGGEYNRATIALSFHVVVDGGSLLSALVHAAMACALEGGLVCRTTLIPSTLAVLSYEDAGNLEVVVNPTTEEENKAIVQAFFVHDITGDSILFSDYSVTKSGTASSVQDEVYSVLEGVSKGRVPSMAQHWR
eukprot:PhF_6_TR13596/c0_g1_i1/m.21753/K12590/RRP46, EXOSC5; exosome complex component RRP46